jgi:hypothetical protein
VVRFPRLLVECVESIPEVASVGMLVWIGVIVTAEAFKQKKYHSAVVVGIIPALASSLSTSNMTSSGMKSLGEGYMLVSLVLASVVAHIVDRRFLDASVWLILASAFSWLGWIHFSNQGDMSEAYLMSSIVTLLFALAQWARGESEADVDREKS